MTDQPVAQAPQAAPVDGQPTGEGQEQPVNWQEQLKGALFRMVFIYMVMNFMTGGKNQPQKATSQDGQAVAPGPNGNLFKPALNYDFDVFISSSNVPDFENDELIWHQTDLVFMKWDQGANGDSIFTLDYELDLNEKYDYVRNNQSIYLHSFFYPTGTASDPSDDRHQSAFTTRTTKQLNKVKKRKYQQTHNLLSGDTEKLEDREKSGTTEWISHWHENITLSICYDQTPFPRGKVPPPLDKVIRFAPGGYKPIVYWNDWWNLQEDYKPINKTDEKLNLRLTFQPLSLFRLQLYISQAYNNEMFSFVQDADEAEGDKDAMKRMFLDTDPWLLALTVVVSISHTVFEMLAFKNDIQFWKTKDNLKGLSIRAVLFNCFCQLIVLLYICDNDTNTMVKFSVGVGLLIELWKVTKCLRFIPAEDGGILGSGYTFEEKRKQEDTETSKYDKIAFKYLGIASVPLMIGYMVYSLMYNEHKGWYSFCLQSCYGFLLMFGFIAMTPQLFINYKLKSTAHLPWRMMTYKALNTFIDDLFAFIIKMPTLYRLGTLRDDLIFFIYLYQKWIYPTDMKRTNEFGITGEQAEGNQPVEASTVSDGTNPAEAPTGKEETAVEPKPVEEKKND